MPIVQEDDLYLCWVSRITGDTTDLPTKQLGSRRAPEVWVGEIRKMPSMVKA